MKKLFSLIVLVGLGIGVWYFWPQITSPETLEVVKSQDVIDLRDQGLESVPDYVWNATRTKKLLLSGNNISSLPSEMGKLVNLEELRVNDNLLTGALPAEIRQMRNLKILDASDNQLTGIPAEIGQMSNLQELYLQNNNIDTYPNEIANLQDLKKFDIRNNAFSASVLIELKALLPNTSFDF